MNRNSIQEILVPGSTKVVVEAKEEHPIFQGLMNTAYDKWQEGGELAGKSSEEFVEELPEKEQIAVRIGNMNYQVQNGGWDQWWYNRYGPRDIQWLIDFFGAHTEYDTFKWILQLLEKVQSASEEEDEEDCEYCGGSGEIEDEDEEGNVDSSPCPECSGSGTQGTDQSAFPENYDTEYYKGDDGLMADVEAFLSGKEAGIKKTVTTEPTQEPAPAPEEELAPAKKTKPKVKLVGADGNAFAILGKVSQALKKAGYSPEEVSEFQREAMSGDYNHLLQTAMKWADVS